MSDKIIITSDGTVKGTVIKVNNEDMTKNYKVTNVYFNAHGGCTYKSQYSGDNYVSAPNVDYSVSYIDSGKIKRLGVGTLSGITEYGALNQKDSLIGLGTEDDERIKEKMLDSLDDLRDKVINIPDRKTLSERTLASVADRYTDIVKEYELSLKENNDKKE